MSRPLRGRQPRKPITVRLEPDVIGLIDREAKRQGITRTAVIERAVTSGTGKDDDRLEPSESVYERPCRHPKDQRQVHSWGAVCGACSQRL